MALTAGDCQRARSAVSLDLDGELSELERMALLAHVARCDACAVYRDDVVSSTSLLRAQPLELLEHPVTVTVSQRTWSGRGLRVSTSAAAAVVVVGLFGAAQFAHSFAARSGLSVASRGAGSSVELKQTYRELELLRQGHASPSFAPNARVQ